MFVNTTNPTLKRGLLAILDAKLPNKQEVQRSLIEAHRYGCREAWAVSFVKKSYGLPYIEYPLRHNWPMFVLQIELGDCGSTFTCISTDQRCAEVCTRKISSREYRSLWPHEGLLPFLFCGQKSVQLGLSSLSLFNFSFFFFPAVWIVGRDI